ncbi:hypothetical protein ACFQ2B_40445 [Streptomyces stramineus]
MVSEYATTARRHWETYRPRELAQMPDPEEFFAELAVAVQERIAELTQERMGEAMRETDHERRAGKLKAAQQMAREQALREIVLLEPEEESRDAELPR